MRTQPIAKASFFLIEIKNGVKNEQRRGFSAFNCR